MSATRTLLSWSSGKDSAWALHVLRQSADVQVVALLTTVNLEFDRVAMHAVRRELLEAQARAAGLPLVIAGIPWPCSNAQYEAALSVAMRRAREEFGITHIAFGDLYLEDVRSYRERILEGSGIEPLFPLWARNTAELAQTMVDSGLRAVLTCVDPRRLPDNFAGREFDARLLAKLPRDVDPCGEGGEFHTFAYAGPMFTSSVPVTVGETVARDGFLFTDVQARAATAEETPLFDASGALSRAYLLARGHCCGNRCRNCPYAWAAVPAEGAR